MKTERIVCLIVSFILLVNQLSAQTNPTKQDNKLDKLITYYSGYTRLHTVCEELSAQFGVTIRCGLNKQDWQVRDIPVVVCANKLKLETLLKYLASAVHGSFRAEKVDDVITYRINISAKQRLIPEKDFEARKQVAIEKAAWNLDALARLANTPEDKIQGIIDLKSFKYWQELKAQSKVIAAMPVDLRTRLLAKEKLTLKATDPGTLGIAVANLYRAFWRTSMDELIADSTAKPNLYQEFDTDFKEETLAKASFDLSFEGEEDVNLIFFAHFQDKFLNPGGIIPMPSFLSRILKDFKPVPEYPKFPSLEKVEPFNMVLLKDSELDFLNEVIKVEKQKKADRIYSADVLEAISKKTGYSIICEDFEKHQKNYRYIFDEANPIIKILERAVVGDWVVDNENKILTANNGDWCLNHYALIPESLFLDLSKKIITDGLEIDDILFLSHLSDCQKNFWAEDFICWHPDETLKSAWSVYENMTPSQKKQFASIDGLQIDALNPELSSIVRSVLIKRLNQKGEKIEDESINQNLTLYLRQTKTGAHDQVINQKTGELESKDMGNHYYNFYVVGNGIYEELLQDMSAYPIYSTRVDMELIELAKKAN